MKKTLLGIIITIFSVQAFSQDTYSFNTDSVAKKYLDQLSKCESTVMGCPSDNQADFNDLADKMMNEKDLNDLLTQHRVKSIFIPLELSNTELLTLAAATSLGVVAFKNDQAISDTISSNSSVVAQKLETVGNFLGTGQAFTGIAAGSYFLGVVFKDNKLKKAGLFMVGANVAQAIVTTSIKNSFGRLRPREDEGPYKFFEKGNKSFFSGHTASAFTVATVIAEMYKEDYPIVPWVAYGAAAVTAYARVHDQAHWGSDVIMGAIAGHLIAKLAMSYFDGDNERDGVSFYPSYDVSSGAVMLNVEWKGKDAEVPLKCMKIKDERVRARECLAEGIARAGK